MTDLSEDGELLALSLDVLLKHLKSHDCSECLDSYQTAIKAITAWVDKEAQPKQTEGGSDGKQKEGTKEEARAERPSDGTKEIEDWEKDWGR